MKNSVKKIIPVLALIVALCCSIAMIAACSSEVVFTGEKEIMSIRHGEGGVSNPSGYV